jgi:hypothetical protein
MRYWPRSAPARIHPWATLTDCGTYVTCFRSRRRLHTPTKLPLPGLQGGGLNGELESRPEFGKSSNSVASSQPSPSLRERP